VPNGTALQHAAVFGITDVVDVLVAAGAKIHSLEMAATAGGITGWSLHGFTLQSRLRVRPRARARARFGRYFLVGVRNAWDVPTTKRVHRFRSMSVVLAYGSDADRRAWSTIRRQSRA